MHHNEMDEAFFYIFFSSQLWLLLLLLAIFVRIFFMFNFRSFVRHGFGLINKFLLKGMGTIQEQCN